MNTPDLERVARLIREVTEAEILPRFRRLEDHHAWEKRPGSIVTVADQAAEKRLEEGLLELTPGAVALGEEVTSERRLFPGDRVAVRERAAQAALHLLYRARLGA